MSDFGTSAAFSCGFDVKRLLTPAAFAHPVDDLQLEETHLSWLILTGPFAYKIKKPLRLDFIDAATSNDAAICATKSCG
jgi:aminoglycoside phosphotransferase family enzyme